MNLIVNGKSHSLETTTLADLLQALEYEGNWLATAVNGDLVTREDRAKLHLAEGDRIEILSPMQGG
jgi:sulfur carrier protein